MFSYADHDNNSNNDDNTKDNIWTDCRMIKAKNTSCNFFSDIPTNSVSQHLFFTAQK